MNLDQFATEHEIQLNCMLNMLDFAFQKMHEPGLSKEASEFWSDTYKSINADIVEIFDVHELQPLLWLCERIIDEESR